MLTDNVDSSRTRSRGIAGYNCARKEGGHTTAHAMTIVAHIPADTEIAEPILRPESTLR